MAAVNIRKGAVAFPDAIRRWLVAPRLREFVALAAATALAWIGGESVVTDPRLAKLLVLAPFVVLALVVEPEKLFIGWLVAAPLVQGAASGSNYGHAFFKYLFLVPPLIMTFRMALSGVRIRGFWVVDALPALYVADVLVSSRLFPSPLAEPQHVTTKAIYITLGPGLIAYYFAAFAKTSPRFPHRVAASFVWSGVAVAVLALVNGMTGWNLWHQVVVNGDIHRSVSTFSSPFEFGSYLGAVLVFAVAILLLRGPRTLRVPSVLLICLGIPSFYFTYTRGVALAFAAVAVLIALAGRRARWPSVLVLVGVAATLVAAWGQIRSSRIYTERLAANTVTPRVVMTDVALDLFRSRPLLGEGYATFDRAKLAFPILPSQVQTVETTTSHNTFLTVLAESGALGLALLVLPWVLIGWRSLTAARRGAATDWIVAACVGATATYVIGAATYDARFFPFTLAIPWITLGLARNLTSGRGASAASTA